MGIRRGEKYGGNMWRNENESNGGRRHGVSAWHPAAWRHRSNQSGEAAWQRRKKISGSVASVAKRKRHGVGVGVKKHRRRKAIGENGAGGRRVRRSWQWRKKMKAKMALSAAKASKSGVDGKRRRRGGEKAAGGNQRRRKSSKSGGGKQLARCAALFARPLCRSRCAIARYRAPRSWHRK
jgi:hypothetical protein